MTVFKLLPVSLDKAEVESRALKLAETCAKRTEVEGARKKAMGDFNQKIKAANEEIERLVESIQNGFQEEDVECDFRKNTESGMMETVRLDTMEVIDTRPLEGNELNENMFDGEGEEDQEGEGGEENE